MEGEVHPASQSPGRIDMMCASVHVMSIDVGCRLDLSQGSPGDLCPDRMFQMRTPAQMLHHHPLPHPPSMLEGRWGGVGRCNRNKLAENIDPVKTRDEKTPRGYGAFFVVRHGRFCACRRKSCHCNAGHRLEC